MERAYYLYTASPFFFIFDKKLYLQSISKIKKNIFKEIFFVKFGDEIVYLLASAMQHGCSMINPVES